MRTEKQSRLPQNIDDKRIMSKYVRSLDTDLENLFAVLHNRVEFGSGTSGDDGINISGQWLDITTNATPDTEDSFAHTIGSIPIGYIVVSRDKAGHIYDGSSSWTSSAIYLRSDVASVTAKIFLLKGSL